METGTLRAIPFKEVYEAIVSRHGRDPAQPIPHNMAQAIPRSVNKRLRTAWTYWEWPYLEVCDERAFARTWLADHQFKAGEAVIFVQDLHYYQAKAAPGSGPPIGTPPTDANFWDPLTDYGHFIPFDQICRRPMGMVLGIYGGDPRNNGYGDYSSCYRPVGNGIAVHSRHGPTVFVKYQLPVPRFTLTPYAPGRQYQNGNLVYDGLSGECYIAIAPSQNKPPVDPTAWLKIEFPEIFEDYVVAGAYADGMKEQEQATVAADQQQARMMWARDAAQEAEEKLVEKIDELRAMGQRFHYQSWRQVTYATGRGVCAGVCFDPGTGEIPAPPVTTLKEICETDPTITPPAAPDSVLVRWQYHPEIVKLKTSAAIPGTGAGMPAVSGPALSGLLTRGTLALGSLVEIVIEPSPGVGEQAQRYQLEAGTADPEDPGQVAPDDYDLTSNNVHWKRVG